MIITEKQVLEPAEFTNTENIVPAVEAMNEISFSNFDYFQSLERDSTKSLQLEFSLLTENPNLSSVKFDMVTLLFLRVINNCCII